MDDLSRVQEHSTDLAAAQQTQGVLWQAGGRPRSAARRKPRKAGPTRSKTSSRSGEGEAPVICASGADSAEGNAGSQEFAVPCYGPDKGLAPPAPSKGTLIDIEI